MKYIIGIDEVGRGPLAGPVTVGIVLCEKTKYKKLKKDKDLPALGKDSKKLSPEKREKYSKYIKSIKIEYKVLHISNNIIDKIGISNAIKKAIKNGLQKLTKGLVLRDINILLDGGLKAPSEFKNQKTIIRGDEKEKIIAWASILAKVSRDNLMKKISVNYPEYDLHVHKGYGTQKHRMAIKKYGVSEIHRISFCKNITRGV